MPKKSPIEVALEDQLNALRRKAMELWIEITAEYDVPYEIAVQAGKEVLQPVNPEEAKLKQYGSASQDVEAEFWYEQSVIEFNKRVKELKI